MIQIPGYVIRSEIGRGGMATVFRAVQTSLDREVALKVMSPTMVSDPSFSRRFLQEARTLASLSHPNIVAVYDVGVTPEQLHYFSMQLLPGGDFLKRIQASASEVEIVRVLLGVARALGFAHQRGFVHRDVAPGNILFDAAGTPVLTDFGIARALTQTSRITNAGVSVGTSHYMSPEQARGGDVDGRSDIYSLGAVSFEALTGKPPYDGDDGFAIAYAHVFEPVPKLPNNLSHWQTFIERAMAKDPKQRFVDMVEVQQALSELASVLGWSDSQSVMTSNQNNLNANTLPIAQAIPKEVLAAGATSNSIQMSPKQTPDVAANSALDHPINHNQKNTGESFNKSASTPPVTQAENKQIVAVPKPPTVKAPAAKASPANQEAAIADSNQIDRARAPAKTVPVVTAETQVKAAPRKNINPAMWLVPTVVALLAVTTWFVYKKFILPLDQQSDSTNASMSSETENNSASIDVGMSKSIDAATTSSVENVDSSLPVTSNGADANLIAGDGLNTTVDPNAIPDPSSEDSATVSLDPVADLLSLAQKDLAALRLTYPPTRNAYERYKAALKLDPQSLVAKQGLVDVAASLLKVAEARIKSNRVNDAVGVLKRAEEIASELPEGAKIVSAANTRRQTEINNASAEALAAEKSGQLEQAIAAWQRALLFDTKLKAAQDGLTRIAAVQKTPKPKRELVGPEMVNLDLGGKKIAVSKTEISVAQFRKFWDERGSRVRASRPSCRDREGVFRSSKSRQWNDPGFSQSGSSPVVCVNAQDAIEYANWLSQKTGQKYRLLNEGEWRRLAQRAPSAKDCKGNIADKQFDKTFGEKDAFTCDDGFAYTAPVGQFAGGADGIFDLTGNVREWVRCGSDCKGYAAMGSAWNSDKRNSAEYARATFMSDVASNTIGFRVARESE